MRKILLTLLLVMALAIPSYAAVGLKVNGVAQGAATEINFSTGTTTTFDGSTATVTASAVSSSWSTSGTAIYNNNTGYVGIGSGATAPASLLNLDNNVNQSVGIFVDNPNAGAAAFSYISTRNDHSDASAGTRIATFGKSFTTSGAFVQDGGLLEARGTLTGGLSIVASNASGVVDIYTGGSDSSNLRWEVDASGNIVAGANGAYNIGSSSVRVKGIRALTYAGQVSALGTTSGTVNLTCTLADTFTLTPNGTVTINAVSPIVGQKICLLVETSGTTSYAINFGTAFKGNGALTTSTSAGKYHTVSFVSDGTNLIETGRVGDAL